MIGPLLLVAATPLTVLEAERGFAAATKRDGQWTAFRAYAAPDAVMFTPQPTNAQTWLRDRKNPTNGIDRRPTAAWVSCDGTVAVDTGSYRAADGSVGYFTTVWNRQADGGWKWVVDSGDHLQRPRLHPRAPQVVRASCGKPEPAYSPPSGAHAGAGISTDHSLVWEWAFNATGHTRVFNISLWDGKCYLEPLEDLVAVK